MSGGERSPPFSFLHSKEKSKHSRRSFGGPFQCRKRRAGIKLVVAIDCFHSGGSFTPILNSSAGGTRKSPSMYSQWSFPACVPKSSPLSGFNSSFTKKKDALT